MIIKIELKMIFSKIVLSISLINLCLQKQFFYEPENIFSRNFIFANYIFR